MVRRAKSDRCIKNYHDNQEGLEFIETMVQDNSLHRESEGEVANIEPKVEVVSEGEGQDITDDEEDDKPLLSRLETTLRKKAKAKVKERQRLARLKKENAEKRRYWKESSHILKQQRKWTEARRRRLRQGSQSEKEVTSIPTYNSSRTAEPKQCSSDSFSWEKAVRRTSELVLLRKVKTEKVFDYESDEKEGLDTD
ncbi:unnamed protein product [Orchesella dallaii]|uniref:Uncharacterized protein n=1 Tax=Orchesella dallaii TaxID=48710 RepID=A0ABP1RVD2_9HEXA